MNESMVVGRALLTGAFVSVGFAVIVVPSLAYDPRLWLGSAPRPIREAVDPLSVRERRLRLALLVPILAVTVGVPLWSVLALDAAVGGLSFRAAFAFMWLVFVSYSLFDLVFIDWLLTVWWQPRFTYPASVEPHLHHNTYRYHLFVHAKNLGGLTALAALLAVAVAW